MPDKQVKKQLPKKMQEKQFKKGVSGNPKGRPKKGYAIADIFNKIGNEIVEVGGVKMTKKEAIMRKAYAEASKGNLTALNLIFDRIEGKAKERIEQEIIRDEVIIK